MRTLFLDGFSGISGDMTVAALLDLGGDEQLLRKALESLHLPDWSYTIARKSSYGIEGCAFNVALHHGLHVHVEGSEQHCHQHHHHHEHRHLKEIHEILNRAELTPRALALAKKIFQIVAEAEAKAHGVDISEVHFHEVGAVDSIVDIVAASVLIDVLGLDSCVITGLSEGTGTVMCQHGELPVPVPAVLNIASRYKIPLRATSVKGERVTPTGIAIAAALRTATELPSEYIVEKVGIGVGNRDFGCANILRAMILEDRTCTTPCTSEEIWCVEANIDDCTGEQLGLAMEMLYKAGARDVCFVPCFMKKNRPAYLVKIISTKASLPQVEMALFMHTTTIGLRKWFVERTIMERSFETIHLPYADIIVKHCHIGDVTRSYPEYDSVKAAAVATNRSYREVVEDVIRQIGASK